jgi:aminoglycoside 6'-N-acetyltransferase I
MSIRALTDRDLEVWSKLRRRLWPATSIEEHRSEAGGILASSRAAAFLSLSDAGEPQGFVEVALRDPPEGGGGAVGYLEGWYVLPPFRGRGVGRGLLAAAEEWAAGKGARAMESDAEAANTAGQKAHERLGFEKVSVLVHYRKALPARPRTDPSAGEPGSCSLPGVT